MIKIMLRVQAISVVNSQFKSDLQPAIPANSVEALRVVSKYLLDEIE